MRGEQSYINKLIIEHDSNPVKEQIGDKSVQRITEVIQDEYWREFRRRLEFSTCPQIRLIGLGSVNPRYSPLKGYIRNIIKAIRRMRKRIERLKIEKPNFDMNNSMTVEVEKQLVLKLKAAWYQLDQMRIIRIMKIIKWNEKQKLLRTPEKIKRDYGVLNWSFKDSLLNNIKFSNKVDNIKNND